MICSWLPWPVIQIIESFAFWLFVLIIFLLKLTMWENHRFFFLIAALFLVKALVTKWTCLLNFVTQQMSFEFNTPSF